MYNESIKESFINFRMSISRTGEAEKYQRIISGIFDDLETIEESLGKDFSQFTYHEMLDNLPVIMKRSITYQNNVLSQLKIYLKWCIEHGYSLDSENRLEGVTSTELDFTRSYSMCMIKDEAQLIEYLDKVFEPINSDSVDSMYRTMMHLIYCGVPFKDTFDVQISEIDFTNKTLTHKGKEYQLTDETIDYINHVKHMNFFTHLDGSNRFPLADNDYIIRTSSDNREAMPNTARTNCSAKLAKLKNYTDYPLTISFTSVWKSGVFNRAYQNEKTNGSVNLKMLENSKENLTEYEGWKSAFSLK